MNMTTGSTDTSVGEAAALRERLTRLHEASLRINESLELDAVLQGVLDSACSLSSARYGAIIVLDDDGGVEALLASRLSPEEFQALQTMPGGLDIFGYLGNLTEPVRIKDFSARARSLDLPEFPAPIEVRAALAVPIVRLGAVIGHIYVARSEPGEEFSVEDEETLVIFAAQAALVVANARRHRDAVRSRDRLETLVDTSSVGVLIFDAATGEPVSSNREAMRIASGLGHPGQSPEEVLRSLTIRRADGREAEVADLPLARLMSAGTTLRAEEITLVAPDGRTTFALLSATPIRARDVRRGAGESESDEVESYVITLHDLTGLERIGRLRADFLGLVSNRLRAPLAAVKGAVTTLLDSGDMLGPVETRQFHRVIRDHSDQMRRLIVDLLDLARIETGALVVSPTPAGVVELVEEARRRFLGGDERSEVSVEIALAPDLPPVMADDWRMVQALTHLFTHVARRLPIGSNVIRVSAEREGLNVALSVSAQQPFEPNFDALARRPGRLPSVSGEETEDDAGLGLAVCQGIVEAHGGRLRTGYDGSGGGARFTMTIPAAQWQPAGAAPASFDLADGAARDRLRVLACDDDSQARRHLHDALWSAGYFPIPAGTSEEALRLIAEERPQVVLMDAALPGEDGSLPERLRDVMIAAEAPVILLTAPGQEEAMAHALELGVSDYLVRPFSESELTARINAALRRYAEPHLAAPSEIYALGDLTIDFNHRRVSLAGSPISLSPHEYGLLAELAMNAGRTLTHDHLLQRVWSPGRIGQRWLLREVVKRLRGKLSDDAGNPTYIFLQRGVGYRMGPVDDAEAASEPAKRSD